MDDQDKELRAEPATADAPHRPRLAGIALMLVAMLAFSLADAAGKKLVTSYGVGELLLLRAIAGLVVLAPLIWRQRAAFAALERPKLQWLRTLIAAAEVAVFYLATAYLPLADVVTFYLTSSLFVSLGAALFLGERIGRARLGAIVIGFCGVLIALQPSAQTMTWPALIAILASVLFAALLLITRALRATPDMVLASQQFAGTLLLGAVLAPRGWITPPAGDLVWFAMSGIVSALGLLCVNRSLRLAPASVVVPYQYTMIVFAAAFGWLMFGDLPSPAMIAGAAIIIASGLYLGWRERRGAVAAPPEQD